MREPSKDELTVGYKRRQHLADGAKKELKKERVVSKFEHDIFAIVGAIQSGNDEQIISLLSAFFYIFNSDEVCAIRKILEVQEPETIKEVLDKIMKKGMKNE